MESINADSELASQLVALLGRELKLAHNENKILLEENKALREKVEVLGGQCLKSPLNNEIKQGTIPDFKNRDMKEEADVAIREFLASFPPVNKMAPKRARTTHICRKSVADYREYLVVDNEALASSSNFLYFSGTLKWYPNNGNYVHSAGFRPTMYYDFALNRYMEKSPFQSFYGKVIELFYSFKKHVFYAGTYKCHDMRSMNVSGALPEMKVVSKV